MVTLMRGMLARTATPVALVIFLATTTASEAAFRGCGQLRGHDLAPAKSVKVVDRGGLLQYCALPHRRIRLLESGIDGSETSEVHYVRQVAGAFAVVTNVFRDKYASAEDTYLVNLRRGTKRMLATTQQDTMSLAQPPDTRVQKSFATSGGRVVATISAPGDIVRVVALGTTGRLQTLAEATRTELPPESLALNGATATWLQSGQPTSATLP